MSYDTLKGGQEARESSRDFLSGAWGGFGSTRLQALFASAAAAAAHIATLPLLNKAADDDTFNSKVQIKDWNFSCTSYIINHYQLPSLKCTSKRTQFLKKYSQKNKLKLK